MSNPKIEAYQKAHTKKTLPTAADTGQVRLPETGGAGEIKPKWRF